MSVKATTTVSISTGLDLAPERVYREHAGIIYEIRPLDRRLWKAR